MYVFKTLSESNYQHSYHIIGPASLRVMKVLLRKCEKTDILHTQCDVLSKKCACHRGKRYITSFGTFWQLLCHVTWDRVPLFLLQKSRDLQALCTSTKSLMAMFLWHIMISKKFKTLCTCNCLLSHITWMQTALDSSLFNSLYLVLVITNTFNSFIQIIVWMMY